MLEYDVMLGFEFTKRLRKVENDLKNSGTSDHHQLVIVCSANSDSETTNIAFEAGVDGFLQKPLNIESLMNVYTKLGGKK